MKALTGGAQTEASQIMKRDRINLGLCRQPFSKGSVFNCLHVNARVTFSRVHFGNFSKVCAFRTRKHC